MSLGHKYDQRTKLLKRETLFNTGLSDQYMFLQRDIIPVVGYFNNYVLVSVIFKPITPHQTGVNTPAGEREEGNIKGASQWLSEHGR